MQKRFEECLCSSSRLLDRIFSDELFFKHLESAIIIIKNCFSKGNKLLIAGNGGSAADAQHFAAELIGRFSRNRIALPAMALTTDTSVITAWSNDVSFDSVFSRQIEGLGKPSDVFFGISTSGESENIIQAAILSRIKGITTIGLLGKGGGILKDNVDVPIIIPSESTPKIQEMHEMLIHFICSGIERDLIKR